MLSPKLNLNLAMQLLLTKAVITTSHLFRVIIGTTWETIPLPNAFQNYSSKKYLCFANKINVTENNCVQRIKCGQCI